MCECVDGERACQQRARGASAGACSGCRRARPLSPPPASPPSSREEPWAERLRGASSSRPLNASARRRSSEERQSADSVARATPSRMPWACASEGRGTARERTLLGAGAAARGDRTADDSRCKVGAARRRAARRPRLPRTFSTAALLAPPPARHSQLSQPGRLREPSGLESRASRPAVSAAACWLGSLTTAAPWRLTATASFSQAVV